MSDDWITVPWLLTSMLRAKISLCAGADRPLRRGANRTQSSTINTNQILQNNNSFPGGSMQRGDSLLIELSQGLSAPAAACEACAPSTGVFTPVSMIALPHHSLPYAHYLLLCRTVQLFEPAESSAVCHERCHTWQCSREHRARACGEPESPEVRY